MHHETSQCIEGEIWVRRTGCASSRISTDNAVKLFMWKSMDWKWAVLPHLGRGPCKWQRCHTFGKLSLWKAFIREALCNVKFSCINRVWRILLTVHRRLIWDLGQKPGRPNRTQRRLNGVLPAQYGWQKNVPASAFWPIAFASARRPYACSLVWLWIYRNAGKKSISAYFYYAGKSTWPQNAGKVWVWISEN